MMISGQESGSGIQNLGSCRALGAISQSSTRSANKKMLSDSGFLISERGFSLITAIFLLVVVASLGTMSVTFFAAQQQSSAIEALGTRAYQAARAGIEWGAFQITQSQVAGYSFASSCQNPATATSSVPYQSSVSMTNTPLESYSLVVSCFAASHVENSSPASAVWVYNLTAAASGLSGASPGDANYVERVTKTVIWQ